MGIRKSFSIKPLSSEGKKALKKSVSIEVIQQTDDAVFQKTLSITKFLCENFLQKSFNLLECPTPNPYAGYSTGILIDTIGERGLADRISLTLRVPAEHVEAVRAHTDLIAAETLALETDVLADEVIKSF